MDRKQFFVLYNTKRNGYYFAQGIKTFWETDILKADRFLSKKEVEEVKRWLPNEVVVKKVTVVVE